MSIVVKTPKGGKAWHTLIIFSIKHLLSHNVTDHWFSQCARPVCTFEIKWPVLPNVWLTNDAWHLTDIIGTLHSVFEAEATDRYITTIREFHFESKRKVFGCSFVSCERKSVKMHLQNWSFYDCSTAITWHTYHNSSQQKMITNPPPSAPFPQNNSLYSLMPSWLKWSVASLWFVQI